MRKMWLTIAVLSLMVAALGGWVAWLEKKPEPPPPTLADLDPESITQVLIEVDGKTMEFRRNDHGWQMVRPFQAPADDYHMKQLTELPKTTTHASYPLSKEQLAKFGLNPPEITVTLNQTNFRFGVQNPIDFRRYVQVDNGPVQLIDDDIHYLLTASATTWIDPRLLPPAASLKGLALPGWTLTLSDKGSWTSTPRTNNKTLRNLIQEWRNARAIEVTPMQGTPPKDVPRITVQLEKGKIEFVVLQKEPELILLRPDLKLNYHFYGNLGKRLLAPETQEPPPTPNARTSGG